MKKKLLTVGTMIAITTPIAAVVACSVNDYGDNFEYYGQIQTVTDAGSIADKSFNESAFDAARTFAETNSTTSHKISFGYSQPKSTSKVLLQKAYLSSLKKGSKSLVLPGFTHSDVSGGDAIDFAKANHSQYPDVRYISPDGSAGGNTPEESKRLEQEANDAGFYNLSYAAEESGYLAAVYAGLYFNTRAETDPSLINGPKLKIATFGGTPIAYGVTSYMDGWIDGMNYFNQIIVPRYNGWKEEENIYANGTSASISDFTGSFDAGAATAKVEAMINKGVQVILPVAGPQTGDVTGVIKENRLQGRVFAIGVDVDQSEVYKGDVILGSAVKGIYGSTLFALEELEKNPDRDAFPIFNHELETDQNFGWDTIRTKFIESLVDGGMAEDDAENKLMFTGFIPAKFDSQIDVTTGSLKAVYDEAKKQKASNQGGFLEVANAQN